MSLETLISQYKSQSKLDWESIQNLSESESYFKYYKNGNDFTNDVKVSFDKIAIIQPENFIKW